MSLIPLAAHLIRLAATDTEYAQDLRDAVSADDQVVSGLVTTDIQEHDLDELTSSQWQWYASWRQELNGGLNRVVLEHLTASATTRFARFQVRELVMRDLEVNALAPEFEVAPDEPGSVGVNWLREQARRARLEDALELVDDALQCATQASWFLLRQLMLLSESRDAVRRELEAFAGPPRNIRERFAERWGLGEPLTR
jgi:hypothetical protein